MTKNGESAPVQLIVGNSLTRRNLLSLFGIGIPATTILFGESLRQIGQPETYPVIDVSDGRKPATLANDIREYFGNSDILLDAYLPAGIKSQRFGVNFAEHQIVSVVMYSDGPVLIHTNLRWSRPIRLVESCMYALAWANDYKAACPFRGEVSALYLTNLCPTEQTYFRLRVLYNI